MVPVQVVIAAVLLVCRRDVRVGSLAESRQDLLALLRERFVVGVGGCLHPVVVLAVDELVSAHIGRQSLDRRVLARSLVVV